MAPPMSSTWVFCGSTVMACGTSVGTYGPASMTTSFHGSHSVSSKPSCDASTAPTTRTTWPGVWAINAR